MFFFYFSAVHEKIFITFMVSSLCYMLTTIKVFNMLHPVMSDTEQYSYNIKKYLFATSIVSTVGLFVFFLKHRFLCHDMGKFSKNKNLALFKKKSKCTQFFSISALQVFFFKKIRWIKIGFNKQTRKSFFLYPQVAINY